MARHSSGPCLATLNVIRVSKCTCGAKLLSRSCATTATVAEAGNSSFSFRALHRKCISRLEEAGNSRTEAPVLCCRGRQQQNRGTCSLLQGQATAEQRHLFSAAEAGNRRTEATVLCYRGRRQPQNRGNCSLLQRRAAAGHSVHMTVDSQARALAAAWPGARY